MKTTFSYSDNPTYYKELIAKINLEVDFPMYLHQMGYTLIAKSAGSMEFQRDGDRIVLQTSREPMTYFNRNDSDDKGRFFKYLRLREDNFYKAVERGLGIIGQVYDTIDFGVKKIKKDSKPIETNYNIVPLRRVGYLTNDRGISKEVLDSDAFKGRIFNAFHYRDDGGKIANIAVPKYDLEGTIKNYILYNKPYRSRTDQKFKKFRLVLNQKDSFLFYSKPVAGKSVRIVFGESIIDLLSYHQIAGRPNNFYVSFGGNVYKQKMDFFVSLFQKITSNKEVEVVSITDNDVSGYTFDLKIFAALINTTHPNVQIETSIKQEKLSALIHYRANGNKEMDSDFKSLSSILSMLGISETQDSKPVRCLQFSDKLVLEFDLKMFAPNLDNIKGNPFVVFLNIITKHYLSFATKISKSIRKDWNEDLLHLKQLRFTPEAFTEQTQLKIGDRIELKVAKGPEGSSNLGTIRKIKSKGVQVDFGLRFTYDIPFSAIGKIHRMSSANTMDQNSKEQHGNISLNQNIK